MTDSFIVMIIIAVVHGAVFSGSYPDHVIVQEKIIMNSGCKNWQSLVDSSIEPPSPRFVFDVSNERDVSVGIECLLRLEGNKSPARFGGALNPGVSQIFDKATTEVAALFYVSYLFKKKFDHANAVALTDSRTGKVNTPESVKSAFAAYRNWFEKIKSIGIEEARKQELDPLEGTFVRWY
jgi:hypothetical protein